MQDRCARLSLIRDRLARKRRESPSRVRRAPRRQGAARRSQRAADLLDVVAFDDVADPHVLVVLEGDAAFLAGLDDSDFVLEPFERRQLAFVDDDVVADQPATLPTFEMLNTSRICALPSIVSRRVGASRPDIAAFTSSTRL